MREEITHVFSISFSRVKTYLFLRTELLSQASIFVHTKSKFAKLKAFHRNHHMREIKETNAQPLKMTCNRARKPTMLMFIFLQIHTMRHVILRYTLNNEAHLVKFNNIRIYTGCLSFVKLCDFLVLLKTCLLTSNKILI